jgi:signal transduction histidine kinase
MVATLLDISRFEQGKLIIERAPIDLCALVMRIVEEVIPSLSIHIAECELPETAMIIDGDELRLEQVVQNLISNAVKYSPDGGTLRVRVAQRGDQACIEVIDQGIGIPAEDIPHLFKRFYRAGNMDEQHISGMGIGLYIVHELVHLHGGSVTVASTLKQGSTFTVCLPIKDSNSETVQGI